LPFPLLASRARVLARCYSEKNAAAIRAPNNATVDDNVFALLEGGGEGISVYPVWVGGVVVTFVLFCACTDVASRSIAIARNRAIKKFEEAIL
jgi:hypothetical protein